MKISCGIAPSLASVEQVRLAEELGYERAWLYDSPALYGDIWATMARVAEHTDRIGLGTAVLVPSLRHVMVTASAIATIEGIAPGRLACGFGTGATARWLFGKDALTLQETGEYLRQLRGLLRGDVVEVDGAAVQMRQLPSFAAHRPIEVPLLLSALGPKGQALTRELADGILTVGFGIGGFDWSAQLVVGTVLEPGESITSRRVQDSAGPWYAVLAHAAWEGSPEAVDVFPGGPQWRATLESTRREAQRHLAVHEGHATTVTDLDRILVDAAGEDIASLAWIADPEGIRAMVLAAEAQGTTEIIYAPSGPDVGRELRAFASAAGV